LKTFIRSRIQAIEIGAAEFKAGAWVARLPELLALPRLQRSEVNGATQAADFICRLSNLGSAQRKPGTL